MRRKFREAIMNLITFVLFFFCFLQSTYHMYFFSDWVNVCMILFRAFHPKVPRESLRSAKIGGWRIHRILMERWYLKPNTLVMVVNMYWTKNWIFGITLVTYQTNIGI